ncbi:hypothetical protein HPB48_017312 [Haemaphysalis longicornis]|uniref:GH18 domain-containing protein n=1 Tax=Haemaphysalis longicornis TaxID=44386 RepID=A0A9J6GYS6_HAELO|nr:hypothetical protein HPB48_017312 [Haemaphysalis longicornis]
MRPAGIRPKQPAAAVVGQPQTTGNRPSRTPSRGTVFPATNAIQIAPEVVLHTPKVPFLLGEDESDSFDAPSPNLHIDIESQRRGSTPEDQKTCKQTWAMCAALCTPLLMSIWLFSLPFLIPANTTRLSITPTQPVTLLSRNTTRPTQPTIDTFVGVPDKCRANVAVKDISGGDAIEVTSPVGNNAGPKIAHAKSVFCLFNNSRFFSILDHADNKIIAYAAQSLPLQFCSHVVYWSLGIEDGQLKSRTPVLDQTYGLYQIRNAAKDRRITDLRVLVALGGYGADLRHFSLLRSNPALMTRFQESLLLEAALIPLDGITIDWSTAPAECHGSSDTADLNALLRAIRDAFIRSQQPDKLVTVMLGHGVSNVALAESVVDVVDHFFIDTRSIKMAAQSSVRDTCKYVSMLVGQAMQPYLTATKIGEDKICTTESLSPLDALSRYSSTRNTFDIISGRQLGREKFTKFCDLPDLCFDTQATKSCLLFRGPFSNTTVRSFAHLYLYSEAETIRDRNTKLFRGYGFCTMVNDLDYDHFGGRCHRFGWYVLMRYLHKAIYRKTTSISSFRQGVPECK